MDDVEPIESIEEGLDLGDPCTITVQLVHKDGTRNVVTFKAPTWTPIYAEPVTGTSIYDIISAAYSYGEAPFLALPLGDEAFRFVDLSSTNFIDVRVVYD